MALKRKKMDFKGSLAEAIVPSDGMQPSARLRRDGALPCKMVITSTHAVPHIPSDPMVKAPLMASVSHYSDHSSMI